MTNHYGSYGSGEAPERPIVFEQHESDHEPVHKKVGAGREVIPPMIPPVLWSAVDSAHHVHNMTANQGFYSPEHRNWTAPLDPHGGLRDHLANQQEMHEEHRRWFGI